MNSLSLGLVKFSEREKGLVECFVKVSLETGKNGQLQEQQQLIWPLNFRL